MSFDLLVSAIIPAYERPEALRKAVRSALSQDLDPSQFEVIVVDSSPDDRNVSIVAEFQKDARCPLHYFTKPAEGPGPSRNLGARHARGRFLAFMDSDCQATPEWLRQGVSAFQDGVGLVQGRTIPEPGVPHHRVFYRSLSVNQESFRYETANVFYRREAFEQAGGFIPDLKPRSEFHFGGEDVELAWTVRRAGWLTRFTADALVMHEVTSLPVWRWLCYKPLFICPRLVHRIPELRRFFFARFFYDKFQAGLILALLGLGLAPFAWPALLLALPYVVLRTAEPSRVLPGPARLLRVLLFLPRDLVSLGLLLAGSVWFRALLL